jgi:hypothetical protein
MKQSPILKRRWRLLARLAPIALFCGGVFNLARSAQAQVALSSEGQAWLRTAISSGSADVLRWPNFSDYSKHVQKFYEINGNSLWWVKGM